MEFVIALSMVPDAQVGDRIAQVLLSSRAAACVNLIGGARSHFRWKGQTCVDAEAVLIAKTRAPLMGRVTEIIEANHPYELPEVIFLPVLGGSKEYLDWVKGETVQESP